MKQLNYKEMSLYVILSIISLVFTYFLFKYMSPYYFDNIYQTILISVCALTIPGFVNKFHISRSDIIKILGVVFLIYLLFNIEKGGQEIIFHHITTPIGGIILIVLLLIVIIRLSWEFLDNNIFSQISFFHSLKGGESNNQEKSYSFEKYFSLILLIVLFFILIIELNIYQTIEGILELKSFFEFLSNVLFGIIIGLIYEFFVSFVKYDKN